MQRLESEQLPSPERMVAMVNSGTFASGFELGFRLGYEICRTARIDAREMQGTKGETRNG